MVSATNAFGKGVLGITETDRSFSAARLFFAYGLGNALYMPFAVGATSILDPDRPTARHVLDVVARHRPTLFYWVPTGFAMLLAEPPPVSGDYDFSSVRLATSAGEALPPALYHRFKARFGVEILDGIGATESMHTFISNRPGRVRPGSSGEIVPGYEARLLGDDEDEGTAVATGDIGNLLVKGDSICVGYWNQPEKTRTTLAGGWLRTGDKFHQDADGYFWHHGRVDDMLKVGGLWVSPVEVEQTLAEHPAVKECAVIGREDADQLVKPCAFVVPADDSPSSLALAEELKQFVRDRIADYKRPRWIEFVDELPRTATGKIQRFKLR
jgi:benzoate-CoA ligase family protein